MAIDFEELANGDMSADQLANVFLEEYYSGMEISYPINPFQMLADLKIAFVLRPFNKYEGIYIPAEDEEDFPIVGINLLRPITRQRFTAAHELCHHLKDVHGGFMCATNAKSEIEKYAENFASGLLMPMTELKKQAQKYAKDGYIDLDGVLLIADYFGVSFQSCLYKIAYRLHMIQGDTDAETLQKLARKYKPAVKRKEKGKYDTVLYEQLFDAIGNNFKLKPTKYACQKFKTEYVFHDSRIEGIDIDMETAAAIVTDLRFHKQDSAYCREENQNIIEVAGLTFAYDYAFRDGNGRTTRAYANMLLLKRAVSPVFFREKEKNEYKEALKVVDISGQYDMLYERFFKSILSSFAALSDFRM